MTDHLKTERRKANKAHTCDLCRLTIPKRMRYVHSMGVDGGVFYRWKMHECCEEATKGWCSDDWEYADDFMGFREETLEPCVLSSLVSEIDQLER